MSTAISQRQSQLRRFQGLLVEWQTKTLASFIASGIQTSKKGRSSLEKMLESIQLFSESKGTKIAKPPPTPEDIVEGRAFEGRINDVGSFEYLTRGMAGPPG